MDLIRSFDYRRNWFLPLFVVAGLVWLLAHPLNLDAIPAVGGMIGPLAGMAALLGILAIATVAVALILKPVLDRGRDAERAVRWLGYALILAFFIFMPAYVEQIPHGSMLKMTVAIQFMIVIVGINLLTGFGGQISLGQGAFFAIGGYTLGIGFHEWGMPWGWSLLIAPILAGVIGFLVAIPALRFKGPYLALATLSLAVTITPLAKKFEEFTGGVQGVAMFGKLSVPFWSDNPDRFYYYLTAVLALLIFVLAANLRRGRFGRALVAIRDRLRHRWRLCRAGRRAQRRRHSVRLARSILATPLDPLPRRGRHRRDRHRQWRDHRRPLPAVRARRHRRHQQVGPGCHPGDHPYRDHVHHAPGGGRLPPAHLAIRPLRPPPAKAGSQRGRRRNGRRGRTRGGGDRSPRRRRFERLNPKARLGRIY
ncbi:MAG: hypothetical protein C4321_06250 [Chloroflexota bacterium]